MGSTTGPEDFGPSGRPDSDLVGLIRPIVRARPDDPIREVARRVSDAGQSCAVIVAPSGLGVVTDHDFRRHVATGRVPPDAPVSLIASQPAITIGEGASRAMCFARMVEHSVHHIVIIDASGSAVGVVRIIDLVQPGVRDPTSIRSSIEAARTVSELAAAAALLPATLIALHDYGAPAALIGSSHASIIDAVLRRILSLRFSRLDVQCSWLLLGSLARREPLPTSDVDTALVWSSGTDDDDLAAALRLEAREVLRDLELCGLRPCPNGANAHNPLFSRSQADWDAAARGWIRDPTAEKALLFSAMIADSRPLTEVALGHHLTDSIRSHTRTPQFLQALLDQALGWRPPTGVLRDFVVERGDHDGQLDLKRGGLAPIVGLARWIAIAVGDPSGTTAQRLSRGVEAGLLTGDEQQMLTVGFVEIYGLLMRHEIAALRAGAPPSTYIDPRGLDPLTRRHLHQTFRAISQVQSRVDQNWPWRLRGPVP